MASTTTDRLAQAQRLLGRLFGEATPEQLCLVISTTIPGKKGLAPKKFRQIAEACQWAIHACESADAYFGLALMRGECDGRGSLEDVRAIGGLWVDLDYGPNHKKHQLPPTLEDCKALLNEMPLVPSCLVHSGHGVHAYWFLRKLWILGTEAERSLAQRILMAWQKRLREIAGARSWGLDSTHDLTRILRVPGTWNHKEGQKLPVEIIDWNDSEYSVDYFLPLAEQVEEPRSRQRATRPAIQQLNNGNGLTNGDLGIGEKLEKLLKRRKIRDTWEHRRADLRDQSLSAYDMALTTMAARAGWQANELAALIQLHRRKWGGVEKGERPDYLENTVAEAMNAAIRGNQRGQEKIKLEIDQDGWIVLEDGARWKAKKVNLGKAFRVHLYSNMYNGVVILTASQFISGKSVRSRIFEQSGVLLDSTLEKLWPELSKMLADHGESEAIAKDQRDDSHLAHGVLEFLRYKDEAAVLENSVSEVAVLPGQIVEFLRHHGVPASVAEVAEFLEGLGAERRSVRLPGYSTPRYARVITQEIRARLLDMC